MSLPALRDRIAAITPRSFPEKVAPRLVQRGRCSQADGQRQMYSGYCSAAGTARPVQPGRRTETDVQRPLLRDLFPKILLRGLFPERLPRY